jgi:hypothetical protein
MIRLLSEAFRALVVIGAIMTTIGLGLVIVSAATNSQPILGMTIPRAISAFVISLAFYGGLATLIQISDQLEKLIDLQEAAPTRSAPGTLTAGYKHNSSNDEAPLRETGGPIHEHLVKVYKGKPIERGPKGFLADGIEYRTVIDAERAIDNLQAREANS